MEVCVKFVTEYQYFCDFGRYLFNINVPFQFLVRKEAEGLSLELIFLWEQKRIREALFKFSDTI